jgi:hypothetical protein
MNEISFLSTNDVVELASSANGTCISIFLPTYRSGRGVMQGAIHLKNLLKDVDFALAEKGMSQDEIQAFTQSISSLVTDEEFWHHQADGLALFACHGFHKVYKLPITVPVTQMVASSFLITPLLPLLSSDGQFYILAVSENDVRLFDATRFSFQETSVEGLPTSMAAAIGGEEIEQDRNWSSTTSGSNTDGAPLGISFGSGDEGSMERHKIDFKRYFDRVDTALSTTFKQRPAPVVLAGVAYLLPIYRQANNWGNLLDGEVHGSQDRATPESIHESAWAVAEPYFEQGTLRAIEAFHQLLGTGIASADQGEVTEASEAGRVATLFVAVDRFGTTPEEDEIVNYSATQTLLKGGLIYALSSEGMPSDQPMAATYRY